MVQERGKKSKIKLEYEGFNVIGPDSDRTNVLITYIYSLKVLEWKSRNQLYFLLPLRVLAYQTKFQKGTRLVVLIKYQRMSYQESVIWNDFFKISFL